jgi:hypothetical protein
MEGKVTQGITRQAQTMGIRILKDKEDPTTTDYKGGIQVVVTATDGHETIIGTYDTPKEAVAACVAAEEILGWR